MTESEWLVSEDPRAMLRFAIEGSRVTDDVPRETPFLRPFISDRKLRLFACACCRLRGQKREVVDHYEKHGPPDSGDEYGRTDKAWARGWTERGSNKPSLTLRAHLLRDIVGNPHRPVTLSPQWRTPTVLDLAHAAYDERLEKLPCPQFGYEPGEPHFLCARCQGAGTIPNPGTLDPARLAVLSDALEEAGCDCEKLLRHLRGEERCPNCAQDQADLDESGRCPLCRSTVAAPGRWAPLRGPHVRGCWALDLILGRE